MSRRLFNFVRRSKVLVLVAVLVLFAGVGTLIAQNPNSTSAMLNQILNIVSKREVNYRVTPAVVTLGGLTVCTVVNVQPDASPGGDSRVINVFLLDRTGMAFTGQTLTVAGGFTQQVSAQLGQLGTTMAHCQFIVENGTRSDIRGAMSQYDSNNNLIFTIPAE